MKRYYDLRAPEYDETTYELARSDPELAPDLDALEAMIANIDAARVLDVACGTGWLSRRLGGRVTLVDQSAKMLEIARTRNPDASWVRADIPPFPFGSGTFDVILACHFYSHLNDAASRQAFLTECARVGSSLVLVEQAPRRGAEHGGWEERRLRDGSRHSVYKRYRTADRLAAEVGGCVLLANPTYVAAFRGPHPALHAGWRSS
jgi:demethylmenaquinone methyltransferase/2-methoxy-6-polyprenyl-1,4-benzoquinol methylase